MDSQRRSLLWTGIGAGAATLFTGARAQAQTAPAQPIGPPVLDPIPNAPAHPTPGKPGDFNFLAGAWRIAHRQRKANGEWDMFDGEATCFTILGGVGSVEELRIPARNFSGMGLRMLDMDAHVWSDFWVNARSGVLTTPGVTGSFENGAGIFISEDMDGDHPIKAAGVWDNITPTTCRWRQATSRDGGRTWQQTWIMNWVRA